jgi:hypothetical protein
MEVSDSDPPTVRTYETMAHDPGGIEHALWNVTYLYTMCLCKAATLIGRTVIPSLRVEDKKEDPPHPSPFPRIRLLLAGKGVSVLDDRRDPADDT